MASESWARADFRSLALSLVASILALTSATDGCSSSIVVFSSAQGRPRKPEGTEPVSFGWVWLADNSNDMMVLPAVNVGACVNGERVGVSRCGCIVGGVLVEVVRDV